MSVLIKGMDMPDSCNECDLISTSFDWFHCPVGRQSDGRVLDLENKNDELIYIKSRHLKCPLIPIPEKHGRLIDADKLLLVIERNSYRLKNFYNSCDEGMFLSGIKQAIDEAPTIIESEVNK